MTILLPDGVVLLTTMEYHRRDDGLGLNENILLGTMRTRRERVLDSLIDIFFIPKIYLLSSHEG